MRVRMPGVCACACACACAYLTSVNQRLNQQVPLTVHAVLVPLLEERSCMGTGERGGGRSMGIGAGGWDATSK